MSKIRLILAIAIGVVPCFALRFWVESRAPAHATVSRALLFVASLPIGALVAALATGTLLVLLRKGPERSFGIALACLYAWYAGYAVADVANCAFDADVREAEVRWVSFERPRRGDPVLTISDPEDPSNTLSFRDRWVPRALGEHVRAGTPITVRYGHGRLGFLWIADVRGYRQGVPATRSPRIR